MHRKNAVKEGDIVFVFVKVAACFHQLMVCDFAVMVWVEIPPSVCPNVWQTIRQKLIGSEITWETPMILGSTFFGLIPH